MTQQLFREAVLARQNERLWGDLILSQPLPVRLLTAFLAMLTLAVLMFLALNQYQRKVAVSGLLVPDGGLIAVAAPVAGTLATIHVQQHQRVEAGTPLFTVELDHTLHTSQAISTRLLDTVQQQANSLRQQHTLEQQNQLVLLRNFRQRLAGIQQKLRQLETLVAQQQELLAIRQAQEERAAQLRRRGMLAANDVENLHAQVVQQQQALLQTTLQHQQAQADIGGLQHEQDTQLLQSRQHSERLLAELSRLEQQRIQLTSEQSTVVVAPVSGRISHLQVQAGMPVGMQQQVLALVPADAALQAELRVPSSAIGFVGEGQPVSLRFDAFPYQKFGVQQGTVRSIAASSDIPAGNSAQQPLYKLVASLDSQSISAYGAQEPLRAGMVLSADIIVDERSLLEWLLEPLYSIRGR